MLNEFKAFILRGNVLDLAVAVIIGAAFGKIVTSLVNDILMPPIGLILGNVNFKNLFVNLGSTHYATLADAQAAGAPTLNYGMFLNTVVDFLIVAMIIFLVIRAVNKIPRRQAAPTAPITKECPFCRSSIALQASRCAYCTSELPATMK